MLPILQLGPLAIPLPGLIILAAFWVGAALAERRAEDYATNPDHIGNLLFYSLLVGILGARLSYAVQFPSAFLASPASLISLDANLLDPWGGIAAAGIFGLVYAQRREMALWPTLDALTPLFATVSLSLGLSHLASGQGYGLPSELPWAIELWGASRHPTQIYETLAAGLILWTVLKSAKSGQAGQLFLRFMLLSASAQLLLGAFRADSDVLPNGWRIAQIVAWLVLAAAILLLRLREGPSSKRVK